MDRIEMKKRYYLGAPNNGGFPTFETVDGAINEARRRLRDNQDRDEFNIVQIVRVVRREPYPVKVSEVVDPNDGSSQCD